MCVQREGQGRAQVPVLETPGRIWRRTCQFTRDRGGQEGEEGEVQRQREGRAGSKLLHTKSEKCPLTPSVH